MPAITQMGAIYFDKEKCIISKDEKLFTIGHVMQGKLYRVNTRYEFPSIANVSNNAQLWHCRLGHLNKNYLKQLAKGLWSVATMIQR